ncbi:hypothetical protein ACS0TY_008210 [Phlomoides rotata]
MSSLPPIKYLHEEESLTPESRNLISTLPKEKGLIWPHLYQYQGFWYPLPHLQGTIFCQKHLVVQESDIFLASIPKSGTTWLKAIMFTLLNRKRFDPLHHMSKHPLITQNPHELVKFLEIPFPPDNKTPHIVSCPRIFATHMPYVSLPESVKRRPCKIVYICRNPKDTLVSNWHFANKLMPGGYSIAEVFDMFCKGVTGYGPYWDHVLEYWKQGQEDPNRVLVLKYEDLKEKPGVHVRRLAEFLEYGFSADEEESGMVDQIWKLCSFDHLSNLKVNKDEILSSGIEKNAFFRKGEVGDWKNYLNVEMAAKIDQITQEKFHGSGLLLY